MIIYAVDDEYLGLELLKTSIIKANPKAILTCFESPLELLKKAKEETPDICFLDIEMPEMNGLDLAKELVNISKKINIIFVTGYSDFVLDAYKMFASGYVLKPVDYKEIKKQLDNLRYPVPTTRIYAKCFGDFSISIDGKPILFRLKRSKELLAYLIDRNGADVSRKQAASMLFEDGSYSRETQKNLSSIVKHLEEDLEAVGASEIFVRSPLGFYVDTSKFDSDLFEYLKGNKDLYNGEYMNQYSWGEMFGY